MKINKKIIILTTSILIIILPVFYVWSQTRPAYTKCLFDLEVKKGDNLDNISKKLEKECVIKNTTFFKAYFRLKEGKKVIILPGKYSLTGSMSYNQIIEILLTPPTIETHNITFYPGSALNFNTSLTDKTPNHRQSLKKVGFDDEQIDQAFKNPPKHQFINQFGKIESLEGLIYGETFNIYKNATISQILIKNFEYYQNIIEKNNLVEKYKKNDLTLYQGIILASIIEREVYKDEDKPIVAQIFLKRLKLGMNLGSDVTYHYANRLAGTENDLEIDSPYNTRKNSGLPPTPISSPSESSLKAVAEPSNTDYLFFLSGDDEKNYYAKTNEEHNYNINNYCKTKCSVD